MTEVLDVRAVQTGSWWTVSVPGMPGLIAQVSSLEPRQLAATLAATTSTADVEDVVEISVRRVQQVAAGAGAPQAGLDHRGAPLTWAEQAVRATRLSPSRVAELLQD